MTADFKTQLAQTTAQVEAALDQILPNDPASLIGPPMRYAVMNGGKRLRAFLAIHSARLFDVPDHQSQRTAVAIECMHAYSLIHDDLPCMDDDDLRRGKPTVHIKWDDATAVLAGDALQAFAFEVLADELTSSRSDVRADLVLSMAQAAGASGMVLGQCQDIAAESAKIPLTLPQITDLQANKTGALFDWAAQSGARLAGEQSEALKTYAAALGLAFQIQDDVLDVMGDAKKAGKRLQKDAEAGKATFVSLLGLEQARAKATSLVSEAREAVSSFGIKAAPLQQVAHYVVEREL